MSEKDNHYTGTYTILSNQLAAGYCEQDLESAGYDADVQEVPGLFSNRYAVNVDENALDSAVEALGGRWRSY
jgi:hypothetical protein